MRSGQMPKKEMPFSRRSQNYYGEVGKVPKMPKMPKIKGRSRLRRLGIRLWRWLEHRTNPIHVWVWLRKCLAMRIYDRLWRWVFVRNCLVVVTLAWSPNAEADLAGYRIFSRQQGQSYNYDNPAWQGTATTCTIDNLTKNSRHYFVARAFDQAGNESGDSDEATWIALDGDLDGDGDVDGTDLARMASQFGRNQGGK